MQSRNTQRRQRSETVFKITATEDEAAIRKARIAYHEADSIGGRKLGLDPIARAATAYRDALGIKVLAGNEARQLLEDRARLQKLLEETPEEMERRIRTPGVPHHAK